MALCEDIGGSASRSPLVVDVDGVLLRSCSADELCLQRLRDAPLRAVRLTSADPAGAFGSSNGLDLASWPENEDLAEYLRREAEAGREIILATSADRAVVAAVATRFPFIGRIVQLPSGMSGVEKARKLRELFPDGFAYAGRTQEDLAVWQHADAAVAVNAPRSVLKSLESSGPAPTVFTERRFNLHTLRKTLRLHQWAKNLLIFVPLVLGGKVFDGEAWLQALLGFLALGLIASATYIINDLIDLPNDRRHPTKRYRPLASGEISTRFGAVLMALCFVAGLGLAVALGGYGLVLLAVYLAVTLSYSLLLKKIPLLDVAILSTLYTLRLGLGIVLAQVTVSSWLLVFSSFVFLSLSLAKRYTEVLQMKDTNRAPLGRGYTFADAPLILSFGVSSAMAALLIMTLFLSDDVFNRPQYVEPHLLWACPPILLIFLGRIWLLAHRGEMHDDPVAFALKDRISVLLGALMVILLTFALTGPRIW